MFSGQSQSIGWKKILYKETVGTTSSVACQQQLKQANQFLCFASSKNQTQEVGHDGLFFMISDVNIFYSHPLSAVMLSYLLLSIDCVLKVIQRVDIFPHFTLNVTLYLLTHYVVISHSLIYGCGRIMNIYSLDNFLFVFRHEQRCFQGEEKPCQCFVDFQGWSSFPGLERCLQTST